MNYALTAAQHAGARDSRAQTTHAGFTPILRRDLLRAIRTTRRRLGLSTGDVLVLDTLLSFLPCRDKVTKADRPIDGQTMLTVYASNASICERANGMDERVLRRHIARLVGVGLLARRDSATCKRFPMRAHGQLVGAYGIDLTPLLCRHSEVTRMAEEIRSEAEEARALRTKALTLRAEILRMSHGISVELHDWVILSKTILRRASLGLGDIRDILARMSEISKTALASSEPAGPAEHPTEPATPRADNVPAPMSESPIGSDDRSAGNGRMVRLVESPNTDTNTARCPQPLDLGQIWSQCNALREFYPEPPCSPFALKTTVYQMGSYIGLGERPLAEAITTVGWGRMLKALDYLVGNAERIQDPARYLSRMVRDFLAGKPLAGLT